MSLELFDAQVGILGASPGRREVTGVDELSAAMARTGIARALVRIAPHGLESDVELSNRKLFDACRANADLTPCAVLVPDSAGDLDPERRQVDEAIAAGAGAAWLRLEADHWTAEPWLAAPLMDALAERALPAYVEAQAANLPTLAGIARRWPDVAILYAGVSYREQRALIGLLNAFRSVRLVLGPNYTVHRGIEQLVERVGPTQLLFGSGFSESEPLGAAMHLIYADVPDDAKRAIGSENLRGLIEGVRR